MATQLGAVQGRHPSLELAVVCRDATLEAIRARGHIALDDRTTGRAHTLDAAYFHAPEDTARSGVQDYVISCLKGHQVSSALEHMRPLIGPATCVVMLQNGLSFWHNASISHAKLRGTHLEAVDPGGELLAAIPVGNAAGCVCRIAVEKAAPGSLQLHTPIPRTTFAFGEAVPGPSARLQVLVDILNDAGVPSCVDPDIHGRIWGKVCVSASANTVNALTAGTVDHLIADAEMRALMGRIMDEVIATAHGIGVRVPVTAAALLEEARTRWRDSKFSMAQDAAAGRRLEIAPYVTAVQEIARTTGTPTPALDTVSALLRHYAANRGIL